MKTYSASFEYIIRKKKELFKAIKKLEIYAHKHTSVHTLCPGLMTFREQPTILFVPLECRYVTAASAAALQLQPDARATKLPQTMRD